jgi:hypothetical protein
MSRASSWRTRPAARTRIAGELLTSRMAQWPTSEPQPNCAPFQSPRDRAGAVGQQVANHHDRLQHRTTGCNSLQQVANHHDRLQHRTTGCNSPRQVANHCNRLQLTATGCSTGQQVANHCNRFANHCNRLQLSATGCSTGQQVTGQQVATHCNRLQHGAVPKPAGSGRCVRAVAWVLLDAHELQHVLAPAAA